MQEDPRAEQPFHLLPALVKELRPLKDDRRPRLCRTNKVLPPVCARTPFFDQGTELLERAGACSALGRVIPDRA